MKSKFFKSITPVVVALLLAPASPVQAAARKVSIGNVSVVEGNAEATKAKFNVKLSRAASRKVKVDFKTVGGSAEPGDDFVAKSGTLVFPAGVVQKKISIAVLGDVEYEGNERFKVRLTNPRRAELADAVGRGTIVDNDPAVVTLYDINTGVVSAGDSVVVEEVLVTAVKVHPSQSALWATELETSDAKGPEYSSIEVFLGEESSWPSIGDKVSLEGTVESPGLVGSYSLLAAATTSPTPNVVTAAQLTGGSEYESVLVTVQNVSVQSHPGNDQLLLSNGVVVDDRIFDYDDNSYPPGTQFASVTAVVDVTGATPIIVPRSVSDFVGQS